MAQVLIYEDDSEFAELQAAFLQMSGYSVIVTAELEEALRHIKAGDIDLAIVDIFIREEGVLVPKGGLMLLGEIKRDNVVRASKGLPITACIAVSGSFGNIGTGELRNYARAYGANSTLTKPFEPDALLAEVEAQLECREMPYENEPDNE